MNNKNSIHNVVINETFNKFLIKHNNYFHISIISIYSIYQYTIIPTTLYYLHL